MNLDFTKTIFQETGKFSPREMTLREVCEVVDDIGVDFNDVIFTIDREGNFDLMCKIWEKINV